MVAIVRNKIKEVQKIYNPSKTWLVNNLDKYTCDIFFRKSTNGQFRSIVCTRNTKLLPRKFKDKYKDFIENPHGYSDIIPVWDVTSREWKSFYFSNIISITVNIGDKND
jgi:hypothetical protein